MLSELVLADRAEAHPAQANSSLLPPRPLALSLPPSPPRTCLNGTSRWRSSSCGIPHPVSVTLMSTWRAPRSV